MPKNTQKHQDLCAQVLHAAKKRRVHRAEVYHYHGRETEVRIRKGAPELVKQAEGYGIGLRIFLNRSMGFAATTDVTAEGLTALVDEAIALARISNVDVSQNLPEPKPIPTRRLYLHDPAIATLSMEQRIAGAAEMEQAALDADTRITMIESAAWSDRESIVTLMNSLGVLAQYRATAVSLVCSAIAGKGAHKQSGYEFTVKRWLSDLEAPGSVGREAAHRAVRKLGARIMKSAPLPVVFDNRVSAGFWSTILGALNGESVLRRRSFLCGALDQPVAASIVTLIDDGLRIKGLASRPFDGEGVPTGKQTLIRKGCLRHYLYNTWAARRAGAVSTGNAARGYASVPGIAGHNTWLKPGAMTPEEVIAAAGDGFYVTGLMGHGVNLVTGDYSRGAEGFRIENGKLAGPVQGVTIAGNLKNMLMGIEAIGNDLEFRGHIAGPTMLIRGMTVSGT